MNQLPTDFRPLDLPLSGPKSGPTAQRESSNKTHLAYWNEAIFQRRGGGNWWMKVQHAGQRRKLSLGTPIKAAAAARARDIYLEVLSNGWEAALDVLHGVERPARTGVTLGQFFKELEAKADLKPKTLAGYAVAFRGIVADIFGIEGGNQKYDHRGGGRAHWVAKIDAIRLADVTPARVQEWKRSFIARAGDDPIRLRSARTSVNSLLRRAKSLFAPGAVKHLSVMLPSPLPFDGIAFEPRQSMRYRSSIDAGALTQAATDELSETDPPVFLAFLLALGAGLRRIEIDRLEWAAFRWEEGVIRIEPTRYFDVKTEHSIGDVPVDPELMAVFRGYAARAGSKYPRGYLASTARTGAGSNRSDLAGSKATLVALPSFVIESESLPIANATFENYRAQAVFERLSAWLKAHGVTARKPVHELRKEFGSMVNRKHGLSAAKDLLRHADIGITAAHYIDRPVRATSGLGTLLGGKIVEFG